MAQGDLGIEAGLRALCKVGKPGFEVESILLPLTEEDIGILDKRSLVQRVEIVWGKGALGIFKKMQRKKKEHTYQNARVYPRPQTHTILNSL